MSLPRATVRLQLRNGVDFDVVGTTLDYYAALGISHLYLSPVLQAQAGSTHGYDTIDYDRVDPALGGEPGLRRLAAAAHAHGMGLIVDFVPNHMSASDDNAWWQDVQRWGRQSPCADHFDIQWHTPQGTPLPLLLPVLDRDYDAALADRCFKLSWHEGEPFVRYGDQCHPLAPITLPMLLRQASMDALASRIEHVLRETRANNADTRRAIREALADADVQSRVSACWRHWAVHDPARLDRLLRAQPYRLAHWRCADTALNWRRFFNINGLVGLRVEREQTYHAVHRTILRLHAEHLIDGLRIDHVDGLAEPAAYCRRLRGDLERQADGRDTWLVVEKILGDGETLPASWPVDGTTGYDFMNEAGAVLHAAEGTDCLTRLYRSLCHDPDDFDTHQSRARRELLASAFACDLDMVAARFHPRLRRAENRQRDLTFAGMRRGLSALAAAFDVYRSYLADGRGQALDRAWPQARANLPPRDHAALDRLVAVMRQATASPTNRAAVDRFEQLTVSVSAKAVEDTAFYRYPRLLSRNEVGANPGSIGMSVTAFHRACARRRQHWPASMLATASHDHKLGEDARMRLAVLSECPRRWAGLARHWMARWPGGKCGPDARERYMMLQMLVGIWPPDTPPDDAEAMGKLAERMHTWLTKALRESKRHTSWVHPDKNHEAAAARLLDDFFADSAFLSEVHHCVRRIAPAGALSSLAQLTLRCTTPGVPDLYQGRELWDFSMVDPDNRRPVDFDTLRKRLTAPDAAIAPLLPAWRDGCIKQAWLARLLRLRERHPDLFLRGQYEPLAVEGEHRHHVIAFLRRHQSDCALVVVPRCALHLLGPHSLPRVDASRWENTAVRLPDDIDTLLFTGIGSGRSTAPGDGIIALSRILDEVPVEVLMSVPPPAH